MPSDTKNESGSSGHGHSRHHKERIGNYVVGAEIGRGSFATVYKGYRSKTREPIAIKAVSRQKLTSKLLENLESEINILKAISHPNITALEDCFKNDTHIYLVMEYCSGSDLSVYIKNRGRLPTLDYVPRGSLDSDKIFFPHPPSGGLDERVTRSFLGQLAHALEFLRKQNLIHRDIKPQNLLLQPASETDLAAGHPLGIPLLKVADFGFARILPASAMAETLCGSPLYMAPEILRYERYDAKVDLWSVGAVLFEMSVGKPPFRAANHVELLRKIEKGEDKIKFPDESSRQPTDPDSIPDVPVPADIKALIRALLKRHAIDRMSFEQFFGSSHIWDAHMSESHSTEDGSLSLEVSSDSSAVAASMEKVKDLVHSAENHARGTPSYPIQPIATDPALNPQPARVRSDLEERRREGAIANQAIPQTQIRPPAPIRRSEPKYYVQDDTPPPVPHQNEGEVETTSSRPIQTPAQRPQRRFSSREGASVEDAPPITPGSNHPPPPVHRPRGVSEGSPLAATPPITMSSTGKDDSALEGDDSMVARDYVVIEKRNVEVNALADELDQATRLPTNALARRPSSRTSVVSRPISAFRPSEQAPTRVPSALNTHTGGVAPMSYSPPFGLSSTPPFAVPPVSRQPSLNQGQLTLTQRTPVPQGLSVFPPVQMYDHAPRYSSSPSAQPGALARVLTNTARRMLENTANAATNALARAASAHRPTVIRVNQVDPDEDELLNHLEEQARFAFVLYEFGDDRLAAWEQLNATAMAHAPTIPARRQSSGSSHDWQVDMLRQQELAAGQSCILFAKALAFIVRAMRIIREFTDGKQRTNPDGFQASQELNDIVQWLRARFNECVEKVEFAKSKYAANELPFIERSLFDRARELSIAAAAKEKEGDLISAERGYENALWLVQTMHDEIIWDGRVRDEDRATVDAWVKLIGDRLKDFRSKLELRQAQVAAISPTPSSVPTSTSGTAVMGDRTYSTSVPTQSSATAALAAASTTSPISVSPFAMRASGGTAPTTGTSVGRATYRPATTTYTPAPLHALTGTPP